MQTLWNLVWGDNGATVLRLKGTRTVHSSRLIRRSNEARGFYMAAQSEMQERLSKESADPVGSSPEAFAA